jgi:hypothetical protein
MEERILSGVREIIRESEERRMNNENVNVRAAKGKALNRAVTPDNNVRVRTAVT